MELDNAIQILRKDGVILCSSGIDASPICSAFSQKAVDRISQTIQQPDMAVYTVLISSINMLEGYVEDIPEGAYQLLEVSDEPVTIVFPVVRNLPDSIKANDGSVRLRLVNTGFIKKLIDKMRQPLLLVSANLKEPIIDQVDGKFELTESQGEATSIIRFDKDGSFKIIHN